MQTHEIIFDQDNHKCVMFSFDDQEYEDKFLAVKQYLIINNNTAVLIDPGSKAIFSELYEAIEKYIPIDNIKFIFFSHQDPDVAEAIADWTVSTQAKILVPKIWMRFMSHYGLLDMNRLHPIPDKGTKINFGSEYLRFVPAHFLHSPGNFSLYDSKAKILFSGDIGANITTGYTDKNYVEDIKNPKYHIESFHKRYMAGNIFCKKWVSLLAQEEIQIIAPQHGNLYKDENVAAFLNWFKDLQCGSDIIDDLY